MRVAAVKSANNLLLQPVSLHGILRFDHSIGQFAQLFWSERLVLCELMGEREHLGLLLSRQPLYFFDHFNARHVFRLFVVTLSRKVTVCLARNVDQRRGMRDSHKALERVGRIQRHVVDSTDSDSCHFQFSTIR